MKRFAGVGLTALAFALYFAGIVFVALTPTPPGEAKAWGGSSAFLSALSFLPLLSFSAVGGVIAYRVPRNPIGWICLVIGFAWTLNYVDEAWIDYSLALSGRFPPLSDWIALGGWAVPVGLMGTFLLLYFPDGRLPSPRWRWIARLSAVTIVAVAFATTVPEENGERVYVPNIIENARPIAEVFGVFIILLPICFIASVVSLFIRYRSSSVELREQIKWIVFACAVVAGFYTLTLGLSLNVPWGGENTPAAISVMQTASLLMFALIPIAVGFAVLRYRLFDIDRLISRTLSYVLLTVVLVGAYLLVVLVSAFAFGGGSDATVAAGTLVAVALFTPARRRVQAIIDRRFNRRRYNARRTVDEFATRLRSRVGLDDVQTTLGHVVSTTLAPSSVWVWVAPRHAGKGVER